MMEIKRYGDQALLVNLEQEIDEDINKRVIALNQALEKEGPKGLKYTIPAYCSLTLAYDPMKTDFDTLRIKLEEIALNIADLETDTQTRTLNIPVCYEDPFALDFEEVMSQTNLSREEIVSLHTNTQFRVFMLGFMPGFTYMGKLPKSLFCKRKQNPRLRVPKGAVGLAGFQTGIYPSELPGGWQIIGRTPLPLFDPQAENPFLFQAGDRVRFISISAMAYKDLEIQVENGDWEYTQIFA